MQDVTHISLDVSLAHGSEGSLPLQRRAQTRGIGAETPAVGLSQGLPVGTVMRAPRGNEILYSRNGEAVLPL